MPPDTSLPDVSHLWGETIDKPVRLFRAGEYPDQQFSASAETLAQMVTESAKQTDIPIDLLHAPTEHVLPLGSLLPQSIKCGADGWLEGTIRIPRVLDSALKARGVSVLIDRATKAIRKLALTPRPVVAGAGFSGDGFAAFAVEMESERSDGEDKKGGGDSKPVPATNASSVTVADAVQILRQIGLSLPEDTTEENLLERIVVAGKAVADAHSDANPETGNQPHEQPMPLVMGEEEQPVPEESPLVKFARSAVVSNYRQRIQRLLETGRITAKYAKEKLEPKLVAFSLDLDAEGNPIPSLVDELLEALESLPENGVLTGSALTASRGRLKKAAFSLPMGIREEPTPGPDDVFSMSEEEVAAQGEVTNEMLAMSGAAPTTTTTAAK